MITNKELTQATVGLMYELCMKEEIGFEKPDAVIRENIPYGFAVHKTPPSEKYKNLENIGYEIPLCFEDNADKERKILSCTLGSLGGGNYFIEIDRDEYRKESLRPFYNFKAK